MLSTTATKFNLYFHLLIELGITNHGMVLFSASHPSWYAWIETTC